jgi:hypothetical protein
MVRRILAIVAVCMLMSGAALAADGDQERKQGQGFSEWLKNLQQKMGQIVPKKSLSLSTGVAGVRGSKENQQVKLYWKGKKCDDSVAEEELGDFGKCVALASAGDKENAVKELEEFMKQYPDSQLIPDAKKTLDLVKQEPDSPPAQDAAAAKAAESSPAPAAEPAKEGAATASPAAVAEPAK